MKHTKGTWEPFSYHNLEEGVRYGVSSSNGKYIGEEMTEGDAHLIANAPEMLGALKEVLRWIQHSDYEYNKHLVKVCRKAIAKAEGGAS